MPGLKVESSVWWVSGGIQVVGTNAQGISYVSLILLALLLVFMYGEDLGKELELLLMLQGLLLCHF